MSGGSTVAASGRLVTDRRVRPTVPVVEHGHERPSQGEGRSLPSTIHRPDFLAVGIMR